MPPAPRSDPVASVGPGTGFSADAARWRFVTGDKAATTALSENTFAIALEDRGTLPSGVPDIVHGQRFFLVDAKLNVRGSYDANDAAQLMAISQDALQLARDLSRQRPLEPLHP